MVSRDPTGAKATFSELEDDDVGLRQQQQKQRGGQEREPSKISNNNNEKKAPPAMVAGPLEQLSPQDPHSEREKKQHAGASRVMGPTPVAAVRSGSLLPDFKDQVRNAKPPHPLLGVVPDFKDQRLSANPNDDKRKDQRNNEQQRERFTRDRTILVSAQLVIDDPQQQQQQQQLITAAAAATQQEQQQQQQQGSTGQAVLPETTPLVAMSERRRVLIAIAVVAGITALVAVVAGIAAFVAILVTDNNNDSATNQSNNTGPTPSPNSTVPASTLAPAAPGSRPTEAPVSAPPAIVEETSAIAAILDLLIPVFPPSTLPLLNETGTCQQKALNESAQDWEDQGRELSDERILQRYTLAVLFCEMTFPNGQEVVLGQDECELLWPLTGFEPCNGDGIVDTLRLSGQELTGTLPPELSIMSSLTLIDFSENNIYGTIPSDLGKLTLLQSLFLYNNSLTGSMPTEICELRKLRDLEELVVDCKLPLPEVDCQCCSNC